MGYDVATAKFTGPLDALLGLIEARKLSINEITLAAVLDDFIAHSRTRTDLTRSDAAAFLAVASTLILIKSRSLVPNMELTTEEERSIGELAVRLGILQEFRRMSQPFGLLSRRSAFYAREAFRGYDFGFVPPVGLTAAHLAAGAMRIIESFPQPSLIPQKVLERVLSIEERARELMNRIGERLSGSLETIVAGATTLETIVGFLAILELIKQGLFDIEQKDNFGKIDVKRL